MAPQTPQTSQTFVHQATGQRYWWSDSEQCYIFEDGRRVRGQPPPSVAQGSRGPALNPPTRDAASLRSNALPSSPPNDRTPRYIPPPQPQDRSRIANLGTESTERSATVIPSSSTQAISPSSAPSNPPIQWKAWRKGHSFGRGSTIHIQPGYEPPVKRELQLGSGTYAHVHRVQVVGTGEVCALKVYKSIRSTDTFRQKFENEIQNMRRVSNRHIAGFFAAYIYERKSQQSPEFAILMQPAAETGTLQYVIDYVRAAPSELTDAQRAVLSNAFGCLSSALEYIHKLMIRHKDVKTDNILVHAGKVFLADFGSSWDGYALGSLVTYSKVPQGHTARYAAPEVITEDPRSAKSDVFSLGGVFYEIFCALEEDAEWYDEEYWQIISDLRPDLAQWQKRLPEVIPLIYRMLDPDPDGRPEAKQLVSALTRKYFCDDCCEEHGKGFGQSGKQVDQTTSRSSIQPNPSVVAGSSAQGVKQAEYQMSRLNIQPSPGVIVGTSAQSGKQTEHVSSRLNIQPSPGIVAGTSAQSRKQAEQLTSRSKMQPNPGVVTGPSAAPVRRGSAPAVSVSQGPMRTYAPRGRPVQEADSSDDEDDDNDSD